MLKGAIDKWLGSNAKAQSGGAAVEDNGPKYDTRELSGCIRNFGIGDEITFYPAGRSDQKHESKILGYRINRKVVLDAGAVELSLQNITIKGKTPRTIDLREVEAFEFILPRDVDGTAAASGDLFAAGAKFSMIRPTKTKGVPSVNLRVRRTTVFEAGPLGGMAVAFLEPNVDSFSFLDRRKYRRINAHIPVQIKISRDQPELNCVIRDFSERHFRIVSESASNPLADIDPNLNLVMFIDLPDAEKRFVLSGSVMRRIEGGIVVRLKGILQDEAFKEISPVSEMSIKASLLNHPSSHRSLDF